MDLKGNIYCGLTIDWNYDKEYVKIYLPTYIPKHLKRFLYPPPQKPLYSPPKLTVSAYGGINEYTKGPKKKPSIYEKCTKYIQDNVGPLLY